jgi:hypothetical protein
MNTPTRRGVAYIAGRIATNRQSSGVFDYNEGRHFSFSGNVRDGNVNVYDYDQGCHISGSGTSLYHYGNGAHLTLQVNAGNFTGYDYASGAHFSGSARGGSVSLYDYETGSYYNFTV